MATLEVTATALNLRATPNGTVLRVLRQGQRGVSSGEAAGGWWPVVFDRTAGFVSAAHVRAQDGGAGPSQAAAPPAPVVVPARPAEPPPPATPPAVDPERTDREPGRLHPRLRQALQQVVATLDAEGIPFRVFEGWRSPERQQWLYAQGRTRPGGIVTKAPPWKSHHQYGLAADLVLQVGGRWSWDAAGARAAHWKRMQDLARQAGLRTLSWELPHVELPVSLDDWADGPLLAEGDGPWRDAVEFAALRWQRGGLGGAPEVLLAQRPPLGPDVA